MIHHQDPPHWINLRLGIFSGVIDANELPQQQPQQQQPQQQERTFAVERGVGFGLSPSFLDESRAAFLALGSAGVVTAATEQLVAVVGVGDVARLCVAVTHAAASDADVPHRVEELK